MSPSDFTRFAIVGPGASTEFLIDALLDAKASNPAIEKAHPKAATWLSLGATFYPVVHEPSHPSLLDALSSVQVVISNVGILDSYQQVPLALAARSAGVELLIPFEYGAGIDVPPTEEEGGLGRLYGEKVKFRTWLEGEGGWHGKWIRVHTGWYADEIIDSFTGFDVFDPEKPPSITIRGDGIAPISYTSRLSIQTFLAKALLNSTPSHSLKTLASASPTSNALRIEAGRLTTNQLLSLVQSLLVSPAPVDRVPSSILQKDSKDHPDDFVLDMLSLYDRGFGIVGKEEGGNWKEWVGEEGWQPETVEEVVRGKLERCGRLKKT